MVSKTLLTRVVALTGAVALAAAGLSVATPAVADTVPINPADPVTAAADGLPTAQINGVVWHQTAVGNKVYVGGEFTRARPAGSAAGSNEVVRNNMMAYDLTTGALDTSFAPNFNAQVKDMAVSPDGTRLYAVGSFTSVNGEPRYRLAAFDTATGALVAGFKPTPNSTVNAVVATNTTVYIAGAFSTVNGQARQRLAAVNATTGANLPLSATIDGGGVQDLVLAPDESSIVFGGSFTSVNGSSNPGYGLARLDASTGAMLPLPVNAQVRNGGTESAVLSLESIGDTFYGTGYHFGGGGNMEGTFAADWATGALTWVEDCHGDTYSSYALGDVIYSASHKHYCGNSGGFPQTDPWTFYRATALTKAATRVNTPDRYGYPDHRGEPSPTILNWYPSINTGTYTGKSQGPWTVSAAGKYVLFGGEFTRVNNVPQQGLVRFALPDVAPNKVGPTLTGNNWNLTATSIQSGEVRLAWPSNDDRDNEKLEYRLFRTTDTSTPIYTETYAGQFWQGKTMRFVDSGLTPGSSVRYRIRAIDPYGNQAQSAWVTVTVSDKALSPYGQAVFDDEPQHLWRLGDSGTDVLDWAGGDDMVAQGGVTRGVAGAINGDTDTASSFNGTTTGLAATQTAVPGPQVFALEGWFKTTTNAGGKIAGFGSAKTGTSGSYDRHVYMTTNGQVYFGVYPGSSQTINSPQSYNNGQWHHFVASLGPDGMKLYLDGKRVAQRANVTSAQDYTGYWRIGGDNSWSGAPFFNGQIDEVAVYDAPLSPQRVNEHYVASGRTSTLPPAPADTYGKAVYNEGPDLYWRLDEGLLTTTAADAGILGTTGAYRGGVTRNQTGALVGVSSNRAATFNGSTGLVASNVQFNNPSVYTEELWFRTNTFNGGKLIGFGDANSGTSSNYDRHVYMETDGRLTFGTWTGTANTITTPASYNDNQWHHLVASQGSDGMKLYVDGVLRGTNPQTQAQAYIGYWRIGGDTTWGPQPWFAGTLDEVAVYSSVLSPTAVAQHYALGRNVAAPNIPPSPAFDATVHELTASVDGTGSTDEDGTVESYSWNWGDSTPDGSGATATHTYAAGGTYTITLTVTDNSGGTATTTRDVTVTPPPPNQPPTAAFTASSTLLTASVNAAGSTDADGTIESYSWNWGDSTPDGSGATATHTYAAGGTYTITLTVTDDDGETATTTRDVTVTPPPPNQPPTAAFTATPSLLTASVNASASGDSDGTIASYAWNWGDSTPDGSGVTASHTYAEGGTYTITLTVTDDDGDWTSTTRTVTVSPPAPGAPFAQDDFGRTVAGGWGSAPLGGAWTTVGTASRLSVSGGRALVTAPAGSTTGGVLSTVSQTSSELTATLTMDRLSTGNSFVSFQGRRVGNDAYTGRVRIAADGSVQVHAVRESGGVATVLNGGTVTGLTVAPNTPIKVKVQVEGTSPTTIRAKAWRASDPEPTAWRATITDSTAALQAAGAVGMNAYHGGSTGNPAVVFAFDDLVGIPVGGGGPVEPPANQPPTAAFTVGSDELTASVNAGGSSDGDGTIASYAWNWGDSTPDGAGVTASHTYATPGTYTITLTVTDDDGATGTAVRTVAVSETPPAGPEFAQDAFARTFAGGWGTAPLGGVWTSVGTASRLAVNGSAGTFTVPAGSTVGAFLGSVAQTSTHVEVSLSPSRLSTGNTFATVQARRVGNDAYGARVRLAADGTVQLHVTREVGGTATAISGGTVAGLVVAPNDVLRVVVEAQGTGPTQLRAKVWKLGDVEPVEWRVTTTDATAVLQVAGGVGATVYHGGSSGDPATVFTFDDLAARPV